MESIKEFLKFNVAANIFKHSPYVRLHAKESPEKMKNCQFCLKILPSFVELWVEKELEMGRKLEINFKNMDEIIQLWEVLYREN